MERPKGVLFAAGILCLMAVWFLVLSGLSWAGRIGDTNDLAVLPADVLRRYQIAGAMSGVLNAGVLIAAGIGVLSVAGWARALGLVLGIWMGLGAMLDLLMGEARLGSAGLLVAALLLTGILFTAPVKAALSPKEPRPTGLTVLGVLYFIQGILMVAVGSPLLLWNAVAGMLILAVLVSVPMIVGAGLLELRSWARAWTLIVSWVTVGLVALGWVLLLVRGSSGDAAGSYIAQNLLVLPLSVFALWYLNRTHVKERFLTTE